MKTANKLQQKQQAFVQRTAKALGITEPEAVQLLADTSRQSVRINTLRTSLKVAQQDLTALGATTSAVPWCQEGLFVDEGIELIRDSTLVEKGEVYIQNAASWLPVLALDAQGGETILDMCAAPGGKTSHIAQRTANRAHIFANDNSHPRLHKLQNNLQRLGVDGVIYSLRDATRLAKNFEPEYFDRILLDAPCSGEGMMTLSNTKAFASWSPSQIKRLQHLQKRLIVQAWQLLKPGGTLIYSTCTMAPEENEATVNYLLRHNEDAQIVELPFRSELTNQVPCVREWNGKVFDDEIEKALRLAPSETIEAFFVVKITKRAL